MNDRAVVARQLGRQPRAFRRVVVRCPFGLPVVTEQAPYDVNGEPFPTTYYLTCSYLVAALARLEAAGGVERWSRTAADDAALAASLASATDEQRRVRRELGGARRRVRWRRVARSRNRRRTSAGASQVPPRSRRVRAGSTRLRPGRADPCRGPAPVARRWVLLGGAPRAELASG